MNRSGDRIAQPMITTILLAMIRTYRFVLSPWIGNSCRYWPTCSEYAMQAIEQHGALRGGWMMLSRLARCHPYSAGGVDPVPQRFRLRGSCPTDGAPARLPLSSIETDHEH